MNKPHGKKYIKNNFVLYGKHGFFNVAALIHLQRHW